eukprot:403365867
MILGKHQRLISSLKFQFLLAVLISVTLIATSQAIESDRTNFHPSITNITTEESQIPLKVHSEEVKSHQDILKTQESNVFHENISSQLRLLEGDTQFNPINQAIHYVDYTWPDDTIILIPQYSDMRRKMNVKMLINMTTIAQKLNFNLSSNLTTPTTQKAFQCETINNKSACVEKLIDSENGTIGNDSNKQFQFTIALIPQIVLEVQLEGVTFENNLLDKVLVYDQTTIDPKLIQVSNSFMGKNHSDTLYILFLHAPQLLQQIGKSMLNLEFNINQPLSDQIQKYDQLYLQRQLKYNIKVFGMLTNYTLVSNYSEIFSYQAFMDLTSTMNNTLIVPPPHIQFQTSMYVNQTILNSNSSQNFSQILNYNKTLTLSPKQETITTIDAYYNDLGYIDSLVLPLQYFDSYNISDRELNFMKIEIVAIDPILKNQTSLNLKSDQVQLILHREYKMHQLQNNQQYEQQNLFNISIKSLNNIQLGNYSNFHEQILMDDSPVHLEIDVSQFNITDIKTLSYELRYDVKYNPYYYAIFDLNPTQLYPKSSLNKIYPPIPDIQVFYFIEKMDILQFLIILQCIAIVELILFFLFKKFLYPKCQRKYKQILAKICKKSIKDKDYKQQSQQSYNATPAQSQREVHSNQHSQRDNFVGGNQPFNVQHLREQLQKQSELKGQDKLARLSSKNNGKQISLGQQLQQTFNSSRLQDAPVQSPQQIQSSFISFGRRLSKYLINQLSGSNPSQTNSMNIFDNNKNQSFGLSNTMKKNSIYAQMQEQSPKFQGKGGFMGGNDISYELDNHSNRSSSIIVNQINIQMGDSKNYESNTSQALDYTQDDEQMRSFMHLKNPKLSQKAHNSIIYNQKEFQSPSKSPQSKSHLNMINTSSTKLFNEFSDSPPVIVGDDEQEYKVKQKSFNYQYEDIEYQENNNKAQIDNLAQDITGLDVDEQSVQNLDE